MAGKSPKPAFPPAVGATPHEDGATLIPELSGSCRKIYRLHDPGYGGNQDKLYVQSHPTDQVSAALLEEHKKKFNKGMTNKVLQQYSEATVVNDISCHCFTLLKGCGLPVTFIRKVSPDAFLAEDCTPIPLESIERRVATTEYLESMHEGIAPISDKFHLTEGHQFMPPLSDWVDTVSGRTVTKDEILAAKIVCGDFLFDSILFLEAENLKKAVFEILENAFFKEGTRIKLCELRLRFAVNAKGRIVLDCHMGPDTWVLWLAKDGRLQENRCTRTSKNFGRIGRMILERQHNLNLLGVAEHTEHFTSQKHDGHVYIMLSSESDKYCSTELKLFLEDYQISCSIHQVQAAQDAVSVMNVIDQGAVNRKQAIFVCVSTGVNILGQMVAGHCNSPVILLNTPSTQWADVDTLASLRSPHYCSCTTVMQPEAAAQASAQIFALSNARLWGYLRGRRYKAFIELTTSPMSTE